MFSRTKGNTLLTIFHEYFRKVGSGQDAIVQKEAIAQYLYTRTNYQGTNTALLLRELEAIVGKGQVGQAALQSLYYLERHINSPSLVESMIDSAKALDIVSEILSKTGNLAQSIVLGGSLAYAPFFSFRGVGYDSPFLPGEKLSNPSDIDMFFLIKGWDDLPKIYTSLKDFVSHEEMASVENFLKEKIETKAEYFQTKIEKDGRAISFEFSTAGIFDRMCSSQGEEQLYIVESAVYSKEVVEGSDLFIPFSLTASSGKEATDLKKRTIGLNGGSIIFVEGDRIEATQNGKIFYPNAIARAYVLPQSVLVSDTEGVMKSFRSRYLSKLNAYLPSAQEYKLLRWERMPTFIKNKVIEEVYGAL